MPRMRVLAGIADEEIDLHGNLSRRERPLDPNLCLFLLWNWTYFGSPILEKGLGDFV
jgi:hypothetical protein